MKITAVRIRRTDQATPLYPQRLSLTSPTSSGLSVGIVRSRTEATEFCLIIYCLVFSMQPDPVLQQVGPNRLILEVTLHFYSGGA
jgi:hypothetical protein